MTKFSWLLFFTMFLFCISISAQETITLSTYYPAPFGVYNRLATQTLGVGDNNISGSIDADDVPDPTDPNQVGQAWIAEKIGIGTMNPYQELHIRSTDNFAGYATIMLEGVDPSNNASMDMWMLMATGTGAPEYGIRPGDFRISQCGDSSCAPENRNNVFAIQNGAADDSLLIKSNGNVGLGKRDPQVKLDVAGGVKIGSESTCNEQTRGTLRYYSGNMQFCSPTGWKGLGGGSSGGGFSVGDCSWGTCGSGFANQPYHGYGWCEKSNDKTGSCSCPAGYTRQLIAEVGEPYPPYWDAIYICVQ